MDFIETRRKFLKRIALLGVGVGTAGVLAQPSRVEAAAPADALTAAQVIRLQYLTDDARWSKTRALVDGVSISEARPAVAATVQDSLHDAAVNYAKKTNHNAAEVESLITAVYKSLPADMPFVTSGANGLLPHETQATALPAPAPSKDANNPSYFVQASLRGFYALSGGYLFAKDIDSGKKLELPWQDRTTYNVYFVGGTEKNRSVGLYDYAPGGTFGTGVSYAYNQDAQYPDRRMIDRVWLADGIMQSIYRDGVNPGAKALAVFADLTTGQVTEYTFNNNTSQWSKNIYAMK